MRKLTTDFHIHTEFSCDSACITYENLISELSKNCITDFGITDHFDYPNRCNEESFEKINDNLSDEAFFNFLLDAFKHMRTYLAKDGSIYVFHADTEGLNFRKAFKEAGFYLSGTCIWKKESLVLGRSPYQWRHEPILFGWCEKGSHNWYSGRKETTIWEFPKPKKNGDHPTMKPIPLLAYPIMNSSLTNSVVLDPFGGSGSTLIACEQTNRTCYTVELDEKYSDVIIKRYIDQVGFFSRNALMLL